MSSQHGDKSVDGTTRCDVLVCVVRKGRNMVRVPEIGPYRIGPCRIATASQDCLQYSSSGARIHRNRVLAGHPFG